MAFNEKKIDNKFKPLALENKVILQSQRADRPQPKILKIYQCFN